MLLTVTLITFLATVAILMAVVYGFSTERATAAERLTELWHPPAPKQDLGFAQKQKEAAQRVLSDIGKLIPDSSKKLSGVQRQMIRAGYRRPEAVLAFRGAKILLIGGSLAAVYFTGLYRQNPFFLIFAGMLGYLIPDFWLGRKVRKRQHRIRLSLPDALDLLVICVEAGLGLDQALLRVAQELKLVHPELSHELTLVNLEMRVGKSRIDALRSLGERTGVDDIKALVAMLIQTDRFGTSVAQSLRVHSDTLRVKRRQRAEEAAAKTPVKMVPVLVFFIFPALLVVVLGPAVITLVRQLLPAMQR